MRSVFQNILQHLIIAYKSLFVKGIFEKSERKSVKNKKMMKFIIKTGSLFFGVKRLQKKQTRIAGLF